MTPEQRAHNMLTHTLWAEWEKFCAAFQLPSERIKLGLYMDVDERSVLDWEEAVGSHFGDYGDWHGQEMKHYRVGDENYEWIER